MSQENRKRKTGKKAGNLPHAQGEGGPASHPAHQGHGGLLPRPAPPSCSVECHRASRATATPPACLEASQAFLSRRGDAPSATPPLSPSRACSSSSSVRFRRRQVPPWSTPPNPRSH